MEGNSVTGKTEVTVPYRQDTVGVRCVRVHVRVCANMLEDTKKRGRQSKGAKGLPVILAAENKGEMEKERGATRREEDEEL